MSSIDKKDNVDDNINAQQTETLKDFDTLSAKLGPTFFSALDIQHRPVAPFINRGSKIPRSIRQKVLDRLVAQHLALTAMQTGLEKTPQALVRDDGLRQHAISLAIAQEKELYDASASGSVYSVKASQGKVFAWVKKKEEEERNKLDVSKIHPSSPSEHLTKKRKRNTTDGSNTQHNQSEIEEADLPWDKALPTSITDTRDIRSRVIKAIDKNSRCMDELDAEDRVTIADACTRKIMGHSSMSSCVVDEKKIIEFVDKYAEYTVLKKKRRGTAP